MTPAKSYRDRLDARPGFPIRRGSVDEVLPNVKPLGLFRKGQA